MYQGNVSGSSPLPAMSTMKVTLMGQALESSRHYVLEVVTEDGEHLSVPNEAIIDRGGHTLVYVQDSQRRVHSAGHQGRRPGRAVHAGRSTA